MVTDRPGVGRATRHRPRARRFVDSGPAAAHRAPDCAGADEPPPGRAARAARPRLHDRSTGSSRWATTTSPPWRSGSAGTPTRSSRAVARCAARKAAREPPSGAARHRCRRVRGRRRRRRCRRGRRAGRGRQRVVVLEQGPHHDADRFSARPPDMLARLYRDGGQTTTLGTPPILLPLGRGHRRHDAGQLGHLLPHAACRAGALAARVRPGGADRGRARTPASRVSRAPSRSPRSRPSWPAGTPPSRAAARRRSAGRTATCAATRRGCVGSGVCAFGCPTSAKQHVGITYVPRAEAAGAHVIAGADVRHVLVERGVEPAWRHAAGDGRELEVRAPHVVVAAGTIHTPRCSRAAGSGARPASSAATSRCTPRPARSR